jgi:hypothetical protein
MAEMNRSTAAVALEKLLSGDSDAAQAIRSRFHRTMLWRFMTGNRLPDLTTAIELQKLSHGRVRADAWVSATARTGTEG